MGSGALQISISLFAILGAAGLALFCDWLRHRNDELKAQMLAMRTGDVVSSAKPFSAPIQHREKIVASEAARAVLSQAPPQVAPEPVTDPAAEAVSEEPAADVPAGPAMETRSRRPRRRKPTEAIDPEFVRRVPRSPGMEAERNAFIERAMTVAAELASREGRPAAPSAPVEAQLNTEETPLAPVQAVIAEEPKSGVVPVLQHMSTDGAMKDWLSRRATARLAVPKLEQEPPTAEVSIAVPLEAPVAETEAPVVEPIASVIEEPKPVVAEESAPAPAPVPAHAAPEQLKPVPVAIVPSPKLDRPQVDLKAWSSLFHDEPKLVVINRHERALPGPDLVVPTGVQDGATLATLLKSDRPYTGLVICISVNEMDERVINTTVSNFLRGLTRPGDTLCRSSKDEFVLLCPDQRGPESRRRLGVVSQQLWDYQLRNLSNFAVQFSWGSEDAWRARLSDALESARESRTLTRRAREQQTESTAKPSRRRAV